MTVHHRFRVSRQRQPGVLRCRLCLMFGHQLVQQRREGDRLKFAAQIVCFDPRQRQQLIDQPRGAQDAAVELLQRMVTHRLVIAGQLNHLTLHAQRCQRAAQLVRRIGGKAPFALDQLRHAGEQAIQRRHQRLHLQRQALRRQRRSLIRRALLQ